MQELEAEDRLQEKLGRMIGGLGEDEVTVPLSAFRGSLPWPIEGRVRSGFGRRKHPRFDTYTRQNGIEIDAPEDAPVLAVHEGTVAFAEHFRGYGLMVVVDHGGKYHTLYAHLAEATVWVGQKVASGEALGVTGDGAGEGPGLYFEIGSRGGAEDPADWLGRPYRPPGQCYPHL